MARQLALAAGESRSNLPSYESLLSYVKRWERGALNSMSERYRLLYARAFGISEEELFAEESDAQADLDVSEDDNVKRRTLLGGLLGAAAVPASFAHQAEPFRYAVNDAFGSVPSGRDVYAWERVAFDYAHEVGKVPAHQVLHELVADFGELNSLVQSAGSPVRQDLMRCVAQLAALTAIVFANLGEVRAARRWWRTAARSADESRDRRIASLVRGREAVFSLYENRPGPSVLSVAEEAIEVGGGLTGAGVVSGHAARAQMLAQLGRHDEAADALNDLKGIFEVLPDSVRNDQSSQWGWSEQRFYHVISHVHSFAGNVSQAFAAQDAALAVYPAVNYQGRSQIEMYRAGSMLKSKDIDEGARHVVRVLEALPPEHRGDGLLQRTAATTLALAPPASAARPAMREARELLAITSGDR